MSVVKGAVNWRANSHCDSNSQGRRRFQTAQPFWLEIESGFAVEKSAFHGFGSRFLREKIFKRPTVLLVGISAKPRTQLPQASIINI